MRSLLIGFSVLINRVRGAFLSSQISQSEWLWWVCGRVHPGTWEARRLELDPCGHVCRVFLLMFQAALWWEYPSLSLLPKEQRCQAPHFLVPACSCSVLAFLFGERFSPLFRCILLILQLYRLRFQPLKLHKKVYFQAWEIFHQICSFVLSFYLHWNQLSWAFIYCRWEEGCLWA